ncbi:MAG: sulfite exporter TauE/SafE family protein [Bacillota bacterium]|nr:sulfite exporter TauE/SafE family protein [Bacillota bacterium]
MSWRCIIINFFNIIVTSLLILAAAVVHGVAGFGFPLIVVPVLSMLTGDIKTVVPFVAANCFIIDLFILFNMKKHVEVRSILPLIISGIIGIPFGLYILTTINVKLLKIAVGVIIVFFGLAMLKGLSIKVRNENRALAFTGFFSGLLNSSLSLGRPPVALFFSNQNIGKDKFIANLAIYAGILDFISIVLFLWRGLINKQGVENILEFLPMLIIGLFIGKRLSSRVSQKVFRGIVIAIIVSMGMYTFLSALI